MSAGLEIVNWMLGLQREKPDTQGTESTRGGPEGDKTSAALPVDGNCVLWRVSVRRMQSQFSLAASFDDGHDSSGKEQKADVSEEGCHEREAAMATDSLQDDRDLWLYRDRTVALLKRYARMAVETGRLPSLLGRECFRTRVTPYALASFEDMAIFVHDAEKALQRLNDSQQQLILLNVLEEYSQWDIARMSGCTTRWIEWQVSDALDAMTVVLLESGLLSRENKRRIGRK